MGEPPLWEREKGPGGSGSERRAGQGDRGRLSERCRSAGYVQEMPISWALLKETGEVPEQSLWYDLEVSWGGPNGWNWPVSDLA